MKTTPGPFAGQLIGSIGGSTACHTGNGPIIRARSLGPSKRTARQAAQAALLATYSARWRQLTEDQRKQWRAAAAADAIPGYAPGLTGHALFVAVNTTLRQSTLPARDVPSLAKPGVILTLANPTQLGTSGTFFLNASRTDFAGSRLVIRATSPAPPQLGESRNPVYRWLATLQGTPISGSFGGWNTAWWTNNAGFGGLQVTWEFRIVSLGGGRGPIHRRVTILA